MFGNPTRNCFLRTLAVSSVVLVASAGCLRRKETITVAADGAVTIAIEYSGETKHFRTNDALPSAKGGWNVARKTEKEGEDRETLTIPA